MLVERLAQRRRSTSLGAREQRQGAARTPLRRPRSPRSSAMASSSRRRVHPPLGLRLAPARRAAASRCSALLEVDAAPRQALGVVVHQLLDLVADDALRAASIGWRSRSWSSTRSRAGAARVAARLRRRDPARDVASRSSSRLSKLAELLGEVVVERRQLALLDRDDLGAGSCARCRAGQRLAVGPERAAARAAARTRLLAGSRAAGRRASAPPRAGDRERQLLPDLRVADLDLELRRLGSGRAAVVDLGEPRPGRRAPPAASTAPSRACPRRRSSRASLDLHRRRLDGGVGQVEVAGSCAARSRGRTSTVATKVSGSPGSSSVDLVDLGRQQRLDATSPPAPAASSAARSRSTTSCSISLPKRRRTRSAGTLPLRKPGMRAFWPYSWMHALGLGLDGRRRHLDLQLLAAGADLFQRHDDAHRDLTRDLGLVRMQWCERGDSNPQPDLSGLDPKSSAYTSSATFAGRHLRDEADDGMAGRRW